MTDNIFTLVPNKPDNAEILDFLRQVLARAEKGEVIAYAGAFLCAGENHFIAFHEGDSTDQGFALTGLLSRLLFRMHASGEPSRD